MIDPDSFREFLNAIPGPGEQPEPVEVVCAHHRTALTQVETDDGTVFRCDADGCPVAVMEREHD